MSKSRFAPLLLAALVPLAACTGPQPVAVVKDGELPIPAGYQQWPKFLSAVQRPDAKQVREIYVNPKGQEATPATGFPDGTQFVMENYAAQANPDGTLKTGPDGKLVKGDLLRVFVMGKHTGWGQDVAPELRNGNWVYSAYMANGTKTADNLNTCRACHAPLTTKDFVHRYDEYFAQRGR